ncbi:uncharacterized protein LOC113217512 [Frankliniella occidentalis]|uniref:Uncharacterized protein LOC113217512 n=1 Tax=Frankliniella occidentalis TaxID=133901 RepID=A0A6J1TI91_FRAOC|nr:uncharacterized protein LOC113217512 [Frankliniella occidentalis]
MECDICLEDFNQVERVPKMVSCGHTVCLLCLQQSDRRQCPTCRRVFDVPPDALPNNYQLLRQLERPDSPRAPRGWCSDCRAAAAPRCWDEAHDVLPEKRALKRHLQGAMLRAAGQLEDLQDHCQGEQAVQALTLLTTESWCLNLQGGGHDLTGNVRNTEDPLTQLMWLLVAAKAALTKSRVEARSPSPAAARPPLAAPGAAPPETRYPPPATATPPPAAAPGQAPPEVREMDVAEVSPTGPSERQQDKAALLAEAPGVTQVVRLFCHNDPAWSLQLLQRAAPTLERLRVLYPLEPHLRAVHAMPRLRRLDVEGGAPLFAQPPELPAVGALSSGHAGLQWLRVQYLPRATTQSLLRAHGSTLEELELLVGTAGRGEWPRICDDLHSLLQQSGLRALKRLVLRRWSSGHRAAACSEQRAQVLRVLPGADVLCVECDDVELGQV